MPRSPEPLTRHNIMLTAGSYEKLQAIYGDSFGAAGAIRLLINSHLKKMEMAADRLPKDILEEEIKL